MSACTCESPLIKCDAVGCRCDICGGDDLPDLLPSGVERFRAQIAELTRERDAARTKLKDFHRDQQTREGKLIREAVRKERDMWLHMPYAGEQRKECLGKLEAAERERDALLEQLKSAEDALYDLANAKHSISDAAFIARAHFSKHGDGNAR